jgi:heme exporter protein A
VGQEGVQEGADVDRPEPPSRGAATVERLAAENLGCARGGRTVFEGLSFSIAAGEAMVVTGPNGAGKSSLLRILAGLLPAAGGEVVIAGVDAETPRRVLIHYLGHLDAVKPALSVAESLAFAAAFLTGRRPGTAVIEAALDTVGLGSLGELPAGHLSAGQKRRLALARLVAAPRPIWLLDEPTAALDKAAEARLGELIGRHLEAGGIIVAATHQPLPVAAAKRLSLGASA